MARKKTSRTPAKSVRRTEVVLDSFSAEDVDRWDLLSAAEQTYHDRVYYDLEVQRTAHHSALCASLTRIAPIKVDLTPAWFRLTDWTYNLTPLSSVGSIKGIGGRFNMGEELDRAPRGHAFPCLYIAQDEATARAEKFGKPLGKLSTYDFALRTPDAFVTLPLEGHVDAILDLRDPRSLKPFVEIIKRFDVSSDTKKYANRHGFAPRLLIVTTRELHKRLLAQPAVWRHEPQNYGIPAPSQIFARYVKEAGFEGILYPSQQGGRLCLALFPQNFASSTSEVRVRGVAPPGATHTVLNKNHLCL